MKIVIIGAGNVAFHLIKSITNSGHQLVQIYNRTIENIKESTKKIPLSDSIGGIYPNADIYIICVKDNAIEEIANQLKMNNKLVLHTSGNRTMDILQNSSSNYGIFYPIQSFTKDIPLNFKKVPIIIEANNAEALEMLKSFAESISERVIEMDLEKRQKLNIAGVFVNNFTNHLYHLMDEYLDKESIDFSILHPIIQNTVDKIKIKNPRACQTGPAIRKDQETIENQKKILEKEIDLLKIYNEFTQGITKL
jgi:predicted short-subunit dehydrogenase-like oxidoreductase (DUF2520 family)